MCYLTAFLTSAICSRLSPGGAVGGSGISQVFVRCSDSHVILDCKPTQPGEPHDIFMKVELALVFPDISWAESFMS